MHTVDATPDDPRHLLDLTTRIVEGSQGTDLPNTVLLPDTEQGRAAAAEINRLTAARNIDSACTDDDISAAVRLVGRSHARNGRRRSRQCRGSRARNFTRAKGRATSVWADAAVTIDAVRSGAYSAAYAKGVES